jgi:Ca2+-binding EF-hand superfamily protein
MVDHFQSLDDDGDALVTMAEITRPMDRMLSYLDRNNDGAITKDELRRGHRKSGKTYRHHDDEKD